MSGNWEQAASWSLGVRPGSSQSVMITNQLWKAVAINPSTPVNFPGSMTVNSLTIRGAWDTQNALLLNYAGTAVPLTVLNGLTLADGARILNFNSGLVVQGGTFTVTNSQIIQEGGFTRTTNAQMYLQSSDYNLTNGVFEGGEVLLGLPVSASFNQYGGSATISNLVFGRGNPSAGGHYSLYGGNLTLPNGLTLMGGNNAFSSYFQAGGTNRTTTVFLEPNLFGISPQFTLNGGLLADYDVNLQGDNFGRISIEQNGGAHVITNTLSLTGGARGPGDSRPADYRLNGGTLSAGSINLNATWGDAGFSQSNGVAQVGNIQGNGSGSQNYFTTGVGLYGGALTTSNLFVNDGGHIYQSGGALTVSKTLGFSGYIEPGTKLYASYTFLGGTLFASDIFVGGKWIIGDSSVANRITNPGTVTLSQSLQISNAVEQLGHFILASSATIDLAGSASRLSFANSSGQTWASGATLVVSNWNGNAAGGGPEQLKFGSNQSGLTPAQLSQIRFSSLTNLYPAKILSTGEVVPVQPSGQNVIYSRQGSNLVLTWPSGWTLQSATNVVGPYLDVPGATSPSSYNVTSEPQRFFRLRQ
ncbi:MAG TPA: hypothetical protein VMZ27_11400 [Candidatus Saccharimonadales bacterium]|nr:hypothetical protein [Candidatus Saccharimonadales bacterium]